MDQPKPKYRNSKQRQRILSILRDTKSHPTASWVYEQLKPQFPSLSLGNVYRNLRILVDQGKILELKFGSTFDRYDGNVQPHYHFICESCGTIEDVEMPHENKLNKRAAQYTNNYVNHHRLEFFGYCEGCGDHRGE